MSSSMRKLLPLLTLLPALLPALLLSACSDSESAPDVTKQSVNSSPTRVAVISASGELASYDTAELSPPLLQFMRGLKIAFMAEEGSHIEAGQLVLGFDSSAQKQELLSKQSELASAQQKRDNTVRGDEALHEQARLQLAEAQMKREKAERKLSAGPELLARIDGQKLQLDLAIARDEVERCTALLKQHQHARAVRKELAAAEIARLQADVERLQSEIKRMQVRAPKSGVVVHKTNWEGNKIAVGDNANWGMSIIEIPTLEKMQVRAEIMEIDARTVAIGQPVDIVLDAQPDRLFKGRVESLGLAIRPRSVEEPTPVFDAIIALDQVDVALMRPGMAARLSIYTGDQTGAQMRAGADGKTVLQP